MIGKTNEGKMMDLVGLYRFSTARRLYVLRDMLSRLRADSAFAVLRNLILDAIALDKETLELETALKIQGSPRRHELGAVELDQALNRALGGLAGRLRAELAVFGEEHPIARSAAVLLQRLFPNGVAAITRLPYVEKSSQVERLLREMEGRSAEGVRRFALERLQARLRELFEAYFRLLGPRERPGLTAELVAERERRGDAELRYIVVYILSAFGRPGVHDDGLCEQLLGPILAQNEDLGVLLKARRAGKKVKGKLAKPPQARSAPAAEKKPVLSGGSEVPELGFLGGAESGEEPEDRGADAASIMPGELELREAGDDGSVVLKRSSSSRRLRPSPRGLRSIPPTADPGLTSAGPGHSKPNWSRARFLTEDYQPSARAPREYGA